MAQDGLADAGVRIIPVTQWPLATDGPGGEAGGQFFDVQLAGWTLRATFITDLH